MRTLRIIGISVGGLVVLLILLLLAAHWFVNPNAYKGRIEQAVRQSTGRELMLEGNIRLSLFPWIALQFGPASLGNPPGFTGPPFAQVQRVSLRVGLLPLLHRRLVIGEVRVDGLNLSLERNARGVGNWQGLGGKSSEAAASAPPGTTLSEGLPQVAGLIVRDSRLSYQDIVADHVSVDMGRVAPGASVPIAIKLALSNGGAPAVPVAMNAQLMLPNGSGPIRLTDLRASVDDSHLTGQMSADLSREAFDFDLALDHLDVDRFLGPGAKGARPTATTAAPSPAGRAAGAGPSGASSSAGPGALQSLRANGMLRVGTVQMAGLTISQIQAKLAAQGGVMHIAPLTAMLYGGQSSGNITADLRHATPTVTLDERVSGVDVSQLLTALAHTQRLSGHGNLVAQISASGSTRDAVMRSVDGHVSMDLAGGAIEGIDLGYEFDRAAALVQKRPVPSGTGSGKTAFQTFRASAQIQNGVATTRDLAVRAENVSVTGQGTFNLVTQAMNYQVQVALLSAQGKSSGAATGLVAAVPLDITGTLAHLQVRPDLSRLAKSTLQQQLDQHKGQIQQKIQDTLRGLFGKHSPAPGH